MVGLEWSAVDMVICESTSDSIFRFPFNDPTVARISSVIDMLQSMGTTRDILGLSVALSCTHSRPT